MNFSLGARVEWRLHFSERKTLDKGVELWRHPDLFRVNSWRGHSFEEDFSDSLENELVEESRNSEMP